MKKWLMCFIFTLSNAYALEAVVTVLETPMLKYKSYDAPVVQYLRKGDIIKVDPALIKDTRYDHLAPDPKKLAELQKEFENSPEWKQDPLFTGKATEIDINDEFIPTLDRQGNKVWIIREHFLVYFNNEKEFDQATLNKDPTDYRLEEPLPENYPLEKESGYRGQVTVGVTQPYYESYDYPTSVKTKGYMSPVDVNITLLRQTPDHKNDRYFFGVTFNVRAFSNSYTLTNDISAKEEGMKLGLGPFISYDAFKGEKNRVALYGNFNVYLFNQLNISQELGPLEEQRNYRTITIAPRMGVQYHRKQIFPEVDFVLGTSMEMEPATTFRSTSAANQDTWWRSGGSDKFKARTTFTLAGYLGFQAAY